ncbi:HIPA PROTEIN [hydrothermal vent metagenome]|uniref:HIPA PROTEIN n=1 Tax=hydrothermal vent metagenome TaxID=652676 RepID=A0A3B0YHU2_9ZZZZ
MISEVRPTECYVYMTLPGKTDAVTAGRYALTTDAHGTTIGRFVYGRSYLERADSVPIDPTELKLAKRTYQTTTLKGVFGALRDASPDYWGRRVIERHVRKPDISEMDYLLYAPDDRAGALGFGLGKTPPAPRRKFNQTLDLEQLQTVADAIAKDEALPPNATAEQIEELMLIGTSMGGARPKAIIENKDGLWLAKFNRPDDKWNNARVEHAMLVLAQHCGLSTAQSKIIQVAGRDVLLVKRFDREKTARGYLRSRMVSALTLLRTQDSHRSRDKWSYVLLAEELRRICAEPGKNTVELFRRMCFNALISNIDDHPRNHAIIAKDRDWKLSPAYDLTPTNPVSLEHRDLALICGDSGRYANAENLVSQSMRFLIEQDHAYAIIAKMENQIVGTWYEVSRGEGVSEHDCKQIAGAFAYPGFRSEQQNRRSLDSQ